MTKPTITTKQKKQFIAISECDLDLKEISYQYIEYNGDKMLVMAIDTNYPERAANLWKNRAFLVSAARDLDISRYVLINFCGFPYGFAMLGHEDLHPEPATRFNVPRIPRIRQNFARLKKL